MLKKLITYSLTGRLLFMVPVLGLATCKSNNYQGITIATAANVQFAMQELTKTFTQKHHIPCRLVVSSSGKLTAQIKEGAPYHLFASADLKYPTTLYKKGLSTASPQVYAWGSLVLWTPRKEQTPSLAMLGTDNIRHIALANPTTAPYGVATIEILKKAKLYQHIKHKLVYGESIAQTNQFILSQSAEVGFTAKSVVVSPQLKNQGKWLELDNGSYSPIQQGVVLIKSRTTADKLPKARKFYDFLFTKKARKILQKYGYHTKQLSQ